MTYCVLSAAEIDELENHDDFKVIWFGSRNYVPNELKNFTDYLEKFYSFKECYNYITNIRNDRTILLVFTDFYEYLSKFNVLRQVQSIYILNKNPEYLKYDKQNYTKIVNIFTDEHMLIERLRQDILLTYRNDLPITISSINNISIEQTLTSFDKNLVLFRWNQLFIYYLVNLSNIHMDQLKKDMKEQCQLEYDNNPIQLKFLDDFDKNCTEDNILEWYTKDSFVYRIVNKAFRTRNIDLICKCRYFIILLHNKLKKLSEEQGQFSTIVYRGQQMKDKELKILQSNIGGLISTNTIMSMTTDEKTARGFIFGATIGVIFHINITNINSNNNFYPFADISQLSSMQHEKEILFFPGAVFRIDSIELESNSIWIIKLTLTNETIEDIIKVKEIFDYVLKIKISFIQVLAETDDYHLFLRYHRFLTGRNFSPIEIFTLIKYINPHDLINSAGDCKKSIEFYKQLLSNTNFTIDSKFIVLNIIIGKNYFHMKQYDEALEHYFIAFSLLDENNRLTGELHDKLGDLYREINDFDNALSSYQQSIIIINNHRSIDKILPMISAKIIDIQFKQNNHEEHRTYEIQEFNEQESIFIDDETLLRIHQLQPNIELDRPLIEYGHKLYVKGMNLIRQGHFSQGLEDLLFAEPIFKNVLPFFDLVFHKLAKLYEHTACAYVYLEDYFNALAKWRRAIDIRTSLNWFGER